MPHLVFQIDEILRLIAEYVGHVSKQAAVEFARCCRAFEEPALRPLWEDTTLTDLMHVLPGDVLCFSGPGMHFRTSRPLTPTERWRLFRYASWVRRITGFVTEDLACFSQILFGLPADDPFPNLRELHGGVAPELLPFLHRFVSPCLTDFSIYMNTNQGLECSGYGSLTDTISAMPEPSLRRFSLGDYRWENASAKFKQEVSAMILRCGPALSCLNAGVELSDQAVLHIIQLPHLLTLKLTHEPPPDITDIISLQDTIVLPSLRSLTLASATSHAWLPLLNDLLWRHPAATAIRGLGQSQYEIGIHSTLEELHCCCGEGPKWTTVKHALAFENLTILDVGWSCPIDACSFDLTDDDVTTITKTLPRIRKLLLGHPCWMNSCQTTFRSMLALSANCVQLTELVIHFNTANIVEDVKSLLETEDPDVQTLRKGPRCRVTNFTVPPVPPAVDDLGTEVLAKGFLFVFPALGNIPISYATRGHSDMTWFRVSVAISRLRGGLPARLHS